MFIRRFLQTSVSFQSKSTDIFLFSNLLFPKEPLKSKLNRYERILEEIGPIYKEIKVERLRNLNNLIIESDDDDFSSIKIGKIGKMDFNSHFCVELKMRHASERPTGSQIITATNSPLGQAIVGPFKAKLSQKCIYG